jgi:hypothetical protein
MNTWIKITEVGSLSEAHVIQSLLKSAGIESQILNENFLSVVPFLSQAVTIQVKKENLEFALKILSAPQVS